MKINYIEMEDRFRKENNNNCNNTLSIQKNQKTNSCADTDCSY
jgi:hypothetical protein